jgi:predicted nucleotidyltransferase
MLVSPKVDTYLRRLTAQVESVFGQKLTAVWLLGSAAYGGFNDSSDLDVQAATESEPTGEELDHLISLIVPRLHSCPAAALEFVLYDRAVLAAPAAPLRWSLNINGGPQRPAEVSRDPGTESWHWFILDLAIGRDLAVTLFGVDLSDVVRPIDRDLQLAAIEESLRWYEEHEPLSHDHLSNPVRALRYLMAGEWGSKRTALAWLAESGRTERQAMAELRMRLQME